MRTMLLALTLCAFAGAVRADEIGPITYTTLAGTVKSPGDTFTYDFFVETFSNTGQGEAILNGTVLAKGKDAGLTTFYADYFFFPVAGSDILASFGNWNLVASVSGAQVVDPPISTPEPSTIVLCLAGLLWALSFSTKKIVQREYPYSHPYRKA